jgi:hypothetical protein
MNREERIRELEGQLAEEETKIKALFLSAKIPKPGDYAERDRIRGELKVARRVKAMDGYSGGHNTYLDSMNTKSPIMLTFNDYRSWVDEGQWEIINGEAYAMTPAPSLKHQAVVSNIKE